MYIKSTKNYLINFVFDKLKICKPLLRNKAFLTFLFRRVTNSFSTLNL